MLVATICLSSYLVLGPNLVGRLKLLILLVVSRAVSSEVDKARWCLVSSDALLLCRPRRRNDYAVLCGCCVALSVWPVPDAEQFGSGFSFFSSIPRLPRVFRPMLCTDVICDEPVGPPAPASCLPHSPEE